jgi:23S rRNA pseudouridine1911/1915/1917 synthase
MIINNTFVNILRRRYQQEIHLLHRLDRETSGLILCARNNEYCRRYQKELKNIMTGKYYLAVIRGRLARETVIVDQPLLSKGQGAIRCRMWVAAEGKLCHTIFHQIADHNDYSLLLVELLTGRKHQIRAHLAYLGLPLVGDKIYGHDGRYFLKRISEELSVDDYQVLGARNHALHAWAVRLKLDDQGERLFFSRIFSDDMRRYLDCFSGWETTARTLLLALNRNVGKWYDPE